MKKVLLAIELGELKEKLSEFKHCAHLLGLTGQELLVVVVKVIASLDTYYLENTEDFLDEVLNLISCQQMTEKGVATTLDPVEKELVISCLLDFVDAIEIQLPLWLVDPVLEMANTSGEDGMLFITGYRRC